MSAKRAKKDDDKPAATSPSAKSGESSSVILIMTAADTTWRMFIPTLGGTYAGLWLDGRMDTAPWFGIGGLLLGIAITAVLVRNQYKKVDGTNA